MLLHFLDFAFAQIVNETNAGGILYTNMRVLGHHWRSSTSPDLQLTDAQRASVPASGFLPETKVTKEKELSARGPPE